MPERHLAFVVGGPHGLLLARPHLSSPSSHTPDTHTRAPFATVQSPAMGAVDGSGWPFSVFAVHTPAAHHCVAVLQSPSPAHVVPHAPLTGLHCEPPGWPMQSLFVVHLPHAPVPKQ